MDYPVRLMSLSDLQSPGKADSCLDGQKNAIGVHLSAYVCMGGCFPDIALSTYNKHVQHLLCSTVCEKEEKKV